MGRDRDIPTSFFRRLLPNKESRIRIADALVGFRSYLQAAHVQFATVQGELSFKDLDRIVPGQQVAPA